ncbi:MAG: glutathione S-transferase [Sneathiella sp.]|nr:glutathione S-transferase [Sneathiella sp.]
MSKPLLVLGNKRYSSWSLRGYLALKFAGLDFEQTVIPLFQEDTHARMKALGPNAPARVPMLIQGDHVVWDTTSLMEFAAENSKLGDLWPTDMFERAHARSICAEMHSGFVALREHIPMNLSRKDPYEDQPEDVRTDIDRILEVWTDCRKKYKESGPYLFGKLSMADAAFAPVVARFKSRSIPVDDISKAYMESIWALPAFAEWREDASNEKWIIDQ